MKILISQEYLIEEYVNKNKSSTIIAKEFGCSKAYILKMLKFYNIPITYKHTKYSNESLINKHFNKLLVQKFLYTKNGHKYYECLCECGNTTIVANHNLYNHQVRSCGCLQTETSRQVLKIGNDEIGNKHWQKIKEGASQRNIEFNISREEANNLLILQNYHCKLSNLKLIMWPLTERTASLDRIINNKGYSKDNCQWVDKRINFMKGQLSQENFIKLCHLVSKNNENTYQ